MQKPPGLDQQDEVKEIDGGNMLGLCEKMPEFCRDALERAEEVDISLRHPRNVVIAGMGGSAIGGELLKDWLHDKASIAIEVCRDYALPAYVDKNSLVIAVSYSGETEETLSAFLEALRRRCMVVTVSSGGHLRAFSQKCCCCWDGGFSYRRRAVKGLVARQSLHSHRSLQRLRPTRLR